MESIGAGDDLRRGLSGPAASAATIRVVDDLEANVRLLERLLLCDMGVVDVFDALTSSRPYKPPIAVERAFDQLTAEAAGGRRDRDLVRVFERVAARLGVSQRPPHQE